MPYRVFELMPINVDVTHRYFLATIYADVISEEYFRVRPVKRFVVVKAPLAVVEIINIEFDAGSGYWIVSS